MIRLELPHPPKGLQPNIYKSLHWTKRARCAKQYRQQCWACAFNHKPDKPLETATIQLTFYHRTAHQQDPDNLTASMKAGIDGLVDAGIFTDDKNLKWLDHVQLKDKDNPRVVVEIEG